jgi:hypothetical protein
MFKFIFIIFLAVLVIISSYIFSVNACGTCTAQYIVANCQYTADYDSCRCALPCLSNCGYVLMAHYGISKDDVNSQAYWDRHAQPRENANAVSTKGLDHGFVCQTYEYGCVWFNIWECQNWNDDCVNWQSAAHDFSELCYNFACF